MILHEGKQVLRNFCYYVLVVPRILKEVFSRSNFSDNCGQVLSSMHSSVQLLYFIIVLCRPRSVSPSSLLKVLNDTPRKSLLGFCRQSERQTTKFDNVCLPSRLNLLPFSVRESGAKSKEKIYQ